MMSYKLKHTLRQEKESERPGVVHLLPPFLRLYADEMASCGSVNEMKLFVNIHGGSQHMRTPPAATILVAVCRGWPTWRSAKLRGEAPGTGHRRAY